MTKQSSTNFKTDTATVRRDALVCEVTTRLAHVQQACESENPTLLRRGVSELSQSVHALQSFVDTRLVPRVNDLVCGTLMVERDKIVEGIRLHGKVTYSDDIGNVCVKFNKFDFYGLSDDNFEAEAQSYLERDIRIKAANMRWQEGCDDWTFDM